MCLARRTVLLGGISAALLLPPAASSQWRELTTKPAAAYAGAWPIVGGMMAVGKSLYLAHPAAMPGESTLFASHDEGETWTGLPFLRATGTNKRAGFMSSHDGTAYHPVDSMRGTTRVRFVGTSPDGQTWTYREMTGVVATGQVVTRIAKVGTALYGFTQTNTDYTDPSLLFASTDGGATWAQTGTRNGQYWAYGLGTTLYAMRPGAALSPSTSTDGGATWAAYSNTPPNDMGTTASGVRLVGGRTLQRSTDGGATWTAVPGVVNVTSIGVSGETVVIVSFNTALQRQTVSRSTDGGQTFALWADGLPEATIYQVVYGGTLAQGGTPVYAFASDGSKVYRRALAESVASEDAPAPPALRLAAPAPNPVRGAVALRFSLDAPAAARLAVYDVLGRETVRPFDGWASAGETVVPLFTAGLAPGVYTLRLTAGPHAATQRLVVVR